jgi:hypothetical protein
MAVESGFNPFAQSPVGAQGLMQVMTGVHSDKYENFGGKLAAFDPVTNLRVGVKVLQECIARAGSLEGGPEALRRRGQPPDDGGYAGKVLAEHARLRQVAGAKAVPDLRGPTQAILPHAGGAPAQPEAVLGREKGRLPAESCKKFGGAGRPARLHCRVRDWR